MHCPICNNQTLARTIAIGDAKFYSCSRCGGLWFEKDELRRAKDERLPDARWFDVDLWQDPSRFLGAASAKACPACSLKLLKLSYGDSGIEIDVCRKCEGIWLDRGEFEKIIRYVHEAANGEVLHHYLENLLQEGKEIVTGPESLRSEIIDVWMLVRLFQYKFAAEHEIFSRVISRFPI